MRRKWLSPVKSPTLRHRELVPQQRLGRHQDQRLAEIAPHLPPQDVEIIGRRRAVGDLQIVLGAQLQIALEPRRAMLRPLPFEAVRKQHDEAAGAQPLGFAGGDELVDDALRAIGEVAELRFPQHQASSGRRANSHIRSRARRIRTSGLSRTSKRPPLDAWSAGYISRRSVWSTQTAWRWLKVPRPLSWPDRRTPCPSATRLPKASASAVAQSKPSPLSNIAFLASRMRCSVLWMARPSGTVVSTLPRRCSSSSLIAVAMLRRPSTGSSGRPRPAQRPSNQSALLGR